MAVNGNEPISTGNLKSAMATLDDYETVMNGKMFRFEITNADVLYATPAIKAHAVGTNVTVTIKDSEGRNNLVLKISKEKHRGKSLFTVPDEFLPDGNQRICRTDMQAGNTSIPGGFEFVFKDGIFTLSDASWNNMDIGYGYGETTGRPLTFKWTIAKSPTAAIECKAVTIEVLMKALGK